MTKPLPPVKPPAGPTWWTQPQTREEWMRRAAERAEQMNAITVSYNTPRQQD